MRLSELWLHPIKSCGGLRVPSASLDRRGLVPDRRWMVVDEAGTFLTQRELPAMARLRATPGEEGIDVVADSGERLWLPFELARGERIDVRVWGDRVQAFVDPAGSAWFSKQLGRPVRVVCMPDDVERPVDPKRAQPGDVVSFADGFPLLVVTASALELLNSKLDAPLTIDRFRPNVVITGAEPHAEDDWQAIRIGAVTLRLVKPCARCTITTVEPLTGVKGTEPLRTLATYRKRGNEVYFGMNAIHDGPGLLHVGDKVEVLS